MLLKTPLHPKLQEFKHNVQHFKARNFHNYNKQSIMYNKNKHESKFRPKFLELYINSIKNTPTPNITII